MTGALVVLVTLLCERDRTATAALVGFFACWAAQCSSSWRAAGGRWCRCPSRAGRVPELPLPERRLVANRCGRLAIPEPPASRLAHRRWVPLLMPFTKRRLSLGLMKTGHLLERVVFTR